MYVNTRNFRLYYCEFIFNCITLTKYKYGLLLAKNFLITDYKFYKYLCYYLCSLRAILLLLLNTKFTYDVV